MLRVRPGQFGEFLDGDPAAVLKAALVDDIRGSLAAFGDDVVGAEVVGGRFEVRQRELQEGRDSDGGGRVGMVV